MAAPRQSVLGRAHVSDEQLAAMVADQLRVQRVTLVAQRVETALLTRLSGLHPPTHQTWLVCAPVRHIGSMRVDWY